MPGADDAAANQEARALDGPLESRIVQRAHRLDETLNLSAAISSTRSTLRWMVAIGVVLFALLGAAAVRTTLGLADREPVNFYLVLGGALGVQTILVAAWLLVILVRPGSLSGGSLGGWTLTVGQRLVRRWSSDQGGAAAVSAIGRVLSRPAIGRWTLSAITHALWLSFNVGALIALVYLLSARHYTFVWETTILDDEAYVTLTEAIAALPRAATFDVPTEAQIRSSRWPAADASQAQAARGAWSSLLLGCVVLYGLGPRLLLLGLSLSMRRSALARYRLDLDRPEYQRLRTLLSPVAQTHVLPPDADGVSDEEAVPTTEHQHRRNGPIALLAFEPAAVETPWPVGIDDVEMRNLGAIETRDDQRRVLADLQTAELGAVIMVCDLTATPDRGASAFARELSAASSAPLLAILSGGQRFRQRADQDGIEQRIEDWRLALAHGGVAAQDVLALDLDHLTADSKKRLRTFLTGDGEHEAGRKLEEACELILGSLERQPDGDALATQAELHRDIARLYSADQKTRWRDMLNVSADQSDLSRSIRRSVDRTLHILPRRLRINPRWIAAGTITGALGCVTAATLLSPVAISALPIWSIIGGAVGGLVTNLSGSAEHEGDAALAAGLSDRLRSAVLFATLLELQGRDETTISRVLDRTANGAENGDVETIDAARRWLDDWRHRFDLALASCEAMS